MKIAGLAGRGILVLLGLLLAAIVVGNLYFAIAHPLAVSPDRACSLMWDTWLVSWIIAMVWSRRATARPPTLDQFVHWLPIAVGFGLLAFGSIATNFTPLWRLPDAAGWALAVVCGVSLFFTWWARISLGSLWSGLVSRKDDHTVIQSGAYRLVRHPIYNGLIVAGLAHAIVIGQVANLAGALLMALGFWVKARLEERFLSQELGAATYSEYRRRTPMLVPFWRARR